MIVDPDIERYMNSLLPPRDAVLAEMEASAAERHVPIVGPAVGGLLALLVMISKAKRIFELGSAIGYSTIWLARAAGPGAEVHYSDGSAANAKQAQGYFGRAGVADRIHIHIDDALGALAQTPGQFDFIFNDVDKEGYPAVLEAVTRRLKTGGLFVTDNTLWHGTVLSPRDESARAVVAFNRKLFESKHFATRLLPLRDGLALSIRLNDSTE
jgi:predicted O-methyltransferase YrrM